MADELTPQQRHLALLNAKDGIALELLATLYAAHPEGERLLEITRQKLQNLERGHTPMEAATEALEDREFGWFAGRMRDARARLANQG